MDGRHETCFGFVMGLVNSHSRQLNRNSVAFLLVLCTFIVGWAHAEPELKIVTQGSVARINRPYHFECEVTWSGNAGQYVVLPAEIGSIDWGTITVLGSTASVRERLNVVSQTIEIVPSKAGEFKVPEIKVSYLNPEATPPAEKAAPKTAPPDSGASPSLRADPFTLAVRPAGTLFWISGGLGASLFLVIAAWMIVRHTKRRSGRTPTNESPSAAFGGVVDQLQLARRHRINGDYYQFYAELAKAAEALPGGGEDHAQLLVTLKNHVQSVGYRGQRPTDDQMDGDYRDIERALTRVKEETQS